MKNIHGGTALGTRCVIYCCVSQGNCSGGTDLPLGDGNTCSSNEECQNIAIEDHGAYCPDENAFVAA